MTGGLKAPNERDRFDLYTKSRQRKQRSGCVVCIREESGCKPKNTVLVFDSLLKILSDDTELTGRRQLLVA